jgi:surface antigen
MFTRHLQAALAGLLLGLPLAAPADPPPWAPAHGWRAQHGDDDGYECESKYKEKKGRYEYREKCKRKGKHRRRGRHEHVDHDVERYEDYGRAVGIASGSCHKEVVGGLIGAAAGGLLGSQVGKGDGRLAATAAGTVLGYIVGSSVGRSMDEVDQGCVGQVLERAPDRQTVAWTDDRRDSRYEVTPTRTYREGERYCRDYVMDAMVDGRPESVTGTACRNPDGTWSRG